MNNLISQRIRAAVAPALACLLAACGGGDLPNAATTSDEATATAAAASTNTAQTPPYGQTSPSSSSEGAIATRRAAMSASPTSDSPSTQLIVRAYATLAGNVGPLMHLRVDGVLIESREIRNLEAADHQFTVPPLRQGSRIDVVFGNDAVVSGADRNLFVVNLVSAQTYMLPTSAGVVLDRGLGVGAFDGLNVRPGQAGIFDNGALRFTWPAPNMPEQLRVSAGATLAAGTGPLMKLRVDGITIGSVEVRHAAPSEFRFAAPPLTTSSRIDVVFANDALEGMEDRNLQVEYLIAGNTFMRPDAAGVVYDVGSAGAAFDGINTLPGQSAMNSNGALRFKWAAPNITSRVTVRASGVLAGNIGPQLLLRVDGVNFGSVEVRSNEPADYVFDVPPLIAGSAIDLVYINPGSMNGVERSLKVVYAISATTVLRTTDAGVVFDPGTGAAAFDGLNTAPGRSVLTAAGALRATWPQPNLTDKLTVRARATLSDDVGAFMSVRVDGVTVSSTEVRASEPADHVFAVPPLEPGSQIDVVFTNDSTGSSADRNLYISYLIAGSTSVLPNAPGAIFDRGVGEGAADGVDTLPATGALVWNGALRLQWPAANVTSKVTVRASGVLAGNVGPKLELRVDGVTVASAEIRSTELADHVLPVPLLRPGSKVDVVYVNDATIDGSERRLNVAYLLAGDTFVRAAGAGVVFDRGVGTAAFDGFDTLPGTSQLQDNGALRLTWPAANVTGSLTLRGSATQAGGVGARIQLRINGVILGSAEVRSATGEDITFAVPTLEAGSTIDIAFTNDAVVGGQDRNLFVHYIKLPTRTLVGTAPSVLIDAGSGEAAFDGLGISPSGGALYDNASMRFTVPAPAAADPTLAQQYAASRFLQQASFGPTPTEISRVMSIGPSQWIAEQMALPARADYVDYIQAKYNLGDAYRPNGSQFKPTWITQRFWALAATSQDQLRKRVGFALHQIFMVSQADANLSTHARAYANYIDLLNRHAFGNYRTLLEAMALSPAMGIYLSHMRNRKEDPITGRMPDENFAREVMQLFTIGLHELNNDGSVRLDGNGRPIETYNNNDVMALAKVFSGFSWALPDNQLTEHNFLWGYLDYSAANDQRLDLQPMKAYPGQHSPSEKRLFNGKPNAVSIPANGNAADSVRIALDTLFNHPNVGPFIARQLIQRLVTSEPSPAYVARVATAFNNNGKGVRGDLAAVVRAVLLDSEARISPAGDFGKLREPVLRVAHWMRSFAATSASGEFMMASDLDALSQRPLGASSVFGYFRPGYVPPNTMFSAVGDTVPELQIVNESTAAHWVNRAGAIAGGGLGWNGSVIDVSSALAPQTAMARGGNIDGLIENLNLLLYNGRMSAALKQDLLDATTTVSGISPESQQNRARVALFLALASPEYLVQR
jgi:uncharacterized protein (DUF1800 family)